MECTKKLVPINVKWYRRRSHVNASEYLYKNLELANRLKPFLEVHDAIVHIRAEKDWINVARMCNRPGYCDSIENIAQVHDKSAVSLFQ